MVRRAAACVNEESTLSNSFSSMLNNGNALGGGVIATLVLFKRSNQNHPRSGGCHAGWEILGVGAVAKHASQRSWNRASRARLLRKLCSFPLRRLTGFGTCLTEATKGQVQFEKEIITTAAFDCPPFLLHAGPSRQLTTGNDLLMPRC